MTIEREFILNGLEIFKKRGFDETQDTVQMYRLALRGLEAQGLVEEVTKFCDTEYFSGTDFMSLEAALAKYREAVGEK